MSNNRTKTNDAARPKGRPLAHHVERFMLVAVWLLIVSGFSVLLPESFFTVSNFAVLFSSQAPAVLLALAVIIPLTAGDYDLSIGSTVTLASMIIGVLNVWHSVPIGYVLPIAVGAGMLVGAINAFFIIYFRIPSLVVTLGTASLITGIVQWMSNSSTISGISPWLVDSMITGQLFGVSLAFYYGLAAALVLWYVFEYTPAGRRLLFVGRGREVARLNGINVGLARAAALVASSVLATLSGIVYAGLLGSADPVSGTNFLLPAFAAAFLGATSIIPGRFNPWGTFVAVYFLATGIDGLSMLGIPLWVTSVFNGGALILAVTLSQFARGREESGVG
jgi:ribose transport system permease protein